MKRINILDRAGAFAENKDVAKDIRLQEIIPALKKGEKVALDFEGVGMATQAFIHALISDVLRKQGDDALNRIAFKSCNDDIKKIVNIVVEYMEEAG